MKKILIALLAVIMCLGCFVGCSEEKKVITVGYTLYKPMNYMEGNELVGFDTDLAKAVFTELGYDEVIFKEINWNNKYMDLETGTIDCVWNGFTSNGTDLDADGNEKPRSELVDFTYNYMINKQVIVVQASEKDSVTDVSYFDGKSGFAEMGSAGMTYAEDNLTGATLKESITQMDAITEVKSKASDFAVVDEQLAKSIVGQGDYADLAIVETVQSDIEYYGIAFKKGSELTAQVNAKLEELAKSGKLLEIATQYKLENAVVTDFSDQKK